jgi:hypothetical protein
MTQDERVFVGGVGNFLHRNIASPTGLVFYKHTLANRLAHFACECTRNNF